MYLLNKNKYNVDYTLYFCILILLFLNLILLKSSTLKYEKFLIKTIFNIIIGLFIMFLFSNMNYRFYEKYSYLFYILSIFLIILVNFFGKTCKGSSRWLNFGILNFQVSEIFKISIPMIISSFAYRYKNINSIKLIFISIFLILIPVIFISIQPDLGTSILIILSGFLTLFFSGINLLNILLIIFLFLILGFIYYNFFMYLYQKNRILILFSFKKDILGSGYHIFQSKIAIGSGGLLGKGLFNGTQSKLNFIPEAHTDFIFSVLAEEFGMIGVIILLFLYLLIIIKCLIFAFNSKNVFKKILISSFVSSMFMSIFINIGMVSGILPIVGIPLPFISYGGSSLIILLIKIGMIISMKNNNKNLYF